ncbi:MAG: lipoate--protein ligase [Oscillospiraceae bacterium]|nr:lipoate--protein ligase [Oscillospiraceae bacterium]
MIERIYIYETGCTDPYHNIATEKYLLEHVEPGSCILYLWQNAHTVVIGRNQNAWAECRTELLAEESGHLARRLSGGGAVYHDMGNLNFTFLVCDEDYNVDKQLSVIQSACKKLGIEAVKSGRNDLLAEGCKFSGNAFYHSGGKAYHHGTLLVNADMDKLSRYLTPPRAKLETKGVTSVRSRVTNLCTLCPGLDCEQLKGALVEAFGEIYGCLPRVLQLKDTAAAQIEADQQTLGSWDWLYGKPLPFSFNCEEKFDWGHIRLQLQVEAGTIIHAEVFSDAMDWLLPEKLAAALTGCRFVLADLEKVLSKNPIYADVLALFKKNI